MKLTDTQRKALAYAMTTSGGYMFAGNNPGGPKIGANTIKALAAMGLVRLGATNYNETWAQITGSGIEAMQAELTRPCRG